MCGKDSPLVRSHTFGERRAWRARTARGGRINLGDLWEIFKKYKISIFLIFVL
jgi:hypothetical protein